MPAARSVLRPLAWVVGLVVVVVSGIALAPAFDARVLRATWHAVSSAPQGVFLALAAYALAFVLRAALWRAVLPVLPFGHALAALHVSLAANHLLPLRLGEAVRVTSIVRRTRIALDAAAASVMTLRAGDVLAVAGLALCLAPRLMRTVAGPWLTVAVTIVALAGAFGWWWLRRVQRSGRTRVRLPTGAVGAGIVLAWLLESAVIWQASRWAGAPLSLADAVLVTAVTIAAQVVAVAPGGVGTYEAAATAAMVALGTDTNVALATAIASHALKTAYALLTGLVAVAVPRPALTGRLRVARPLPRPTPGAGVSPRAPVVLFLPAHNEEARVGAVVARVPRCVHGRPVVCVVVDDGSTDATADVAAAAGATVSGGRHAGLGAAVRRGLAEAVALGAAAVAFCDADGEYDPAELERLVGPILAGDADYVVGSRFSGTIHHMRPHRRLGNVVLTRLLTFVARLRITDGQSGFRALSGTAAANAEIIHDFNYAQVLTLDLLAKGYRYAEVPISYRFRTSGESFVRLGRYLRAVLPAMHREVNGVGVSLAE